MHSRLLAAAGVRPGRWRFVDVVDCTAARVTPIGPESRWNVDGELLPNNAITTHVHRGLLEVFARGVE